MLPSKENDVSLQRPTTLRQFDWFRDYGINRIGEDFRLFACYDLYTRFYQLHLEKQMRCFIGMVLAAIVLLFALPFIGLDWVFGWKTANFLFGWTIQPLTWVADPELYRLKRDWANLVEQIRKARNQ